MKLVLQITSVFDENIKMQIRNIPTLFWYILQQKCHLTQQVHFVQQSAALVISPNWLNCDMQQTTEDDRPHGEAWVE